MNVPKLRFGEFKSSWKFMKLGQLGNTIAGLTYSPKDIRDSGLLVLRSSNVKDGQIDLGDCVYVDTNVKGAKISQENDILICVRNGSTSLIGKNALIPAGIPHCTHGAFMTVFRAEQPKFIHQLFQTTNYKTQVSADLGARINSINNSQLIKYQFAVPPTECEQQKIADFLSAVDDKITALTAQKTALTQYKQGMMQRIFSQTLRFKDDNGADYPDWKIGELKQFCQVNPKAENLPDEFIYIDLESVESGQLLKENLVFIEDAPSRAQRLLQVNDVLFQMVRPYQQNNLFFDKVGQYVASTGYAQIRTSENPKFLYYCLHVQEFVSEVMNRCTGTSYPAINSTDLETIEIAIPAIEEQTKIAQFLTELDDKINAVDAQIQSAQQWKQGLLQQMFV